MDLQERMNLIVERRAVIRDVFKNIQIKFGLVILILKIKILDYLKREGNLSIPELCSSENNEILYLRTGI